MTADDVNVMLSTLEGTHRLSIRQSVSEWTRLFWISLLPATVLLLILLPAVTMARSLKMEWLVDWLVLPARPEVLFGVLGAIALAAQMRSYTIDSSRVSARPSWLGGFTIERSDITHVRVESGLHCKYLMLSTRGGQEHRLLLTASMARAIGLQPRGF